MKKLAFVLLVMLMAGVVLSACGSGNADSAVERIGAAPSISQGNTNHAGSAAESIQGSGNVPGWAHYPVGSLAPEPNNNILEVHTNTDVDFSVVMDWNRDEAAAYAEIAKAAGFDKSITIADTDGNYIFQAENKDGVYISISYVLDTVGPGQITMTTDSTYDLDY